MEEKVEVAKRLYDEIQEALDSFKAIATKHGYTLRFYVDSEYLHFKYCEIGQEESTCLSLGKWKITDMLEIPHLVEKTLVQKDGIWHLKFPRPWLANLCDIAKAEYNKLKDVE